MDAENINQLWAVVAEHGLDLIIKLLAAIFFWILGGMLVNKAVSLTRSGDLRSSKIWHHSTHNARRTAAQQATALNNSATSTHSHRRNLVCPMNHQS